MGISFAPSMRQTSYSHGSRTSINSSLSPASSRFFNSATEISSSLIHGILQQVSGRGIAAHAFRRMRERPQDNPRKRNISFDAGLQFPERAPGLLFGWQRALSWLRESPAAARKRLS